MDLEQIHELSAHNKNLLAKSEQCGCFHCLKQFNFTEVVKYVDKGETALCPYCEIDSVIPLSTNDSDLLKKMCDKYFY